MVLTLLSFALMVAATDVSAPIPTKCPAAGTVRLRVPDVALTCQGAGFGDCRGDMIVEVTNCGAEVAEVLRLDFTAVSPASAARGRSPLPSWSVDFAPKTFVVAPATSRSFRQRIDAEARLTASAEVRSAGRTWLDGQAVARATIPKRDAAMAACRACRGDWGPEGMLQIEGCNCRTRDAGRVCRDGKECEAVCLYNHLERGRQVGKCSPFRTMWSCHDIIPAGAAHDPPRGPQDRYNVCTD